MGEGEEGFFEVVVGHGGFTIYDLRFTIYDLRFTIYDLDYSAPEARELRSGSGGGGAGLI